MTQGCIIEFSLHGCLHLWFWQGIVTIPSTHGIEWVMPLNTQAND
jgi:hypothetical protein